MIVPACEGDGAMSRRRPPTAGATWRPTLRRRRSRQDQRARGGATSRWGRSRYARTPARKRAPVGSPATPVDDVHRELVVLLARCDLARARDDGICDLRVQTAELMVRACRRG